MDVILGGPAEGHLPSAPATRWREALEGLSRPRTRRHAGTQARRHVWEAPSPFAKEPTSARKKKSILDTSHAILSGLCEASRRNPCPINQGL